MNAVHATFLKGFDAAFEKGDEKAKTRTGEASLVQKAKDFYQNILGRDYEAVKKLLATDTRFVLLGPQTFPSHGSQGADNVIRDIKQNFESIESEECQVESLVAQGDLVVFTARDRGKMLANNQPYHVYFVVELTFRDGKIAEARQWMVPGSNA